MKLDLVVKKFGKEYSANDDTYHMGIHYLLGNAIAKRFYGHKICLDTCLGAGFMALALAKHVNKVIGVDINPLHLEQAKHNAGLALIEEKIEFILGDALKIIRTIIEIDSGFLDPDWARIGDNKENHTPKLSQMVPPANVLLEEVFKKTKNVCLRLPKEFNLENLRGFPEHEIESVYLDDKLKFYCIYFGDLIKNTKSSELRVLITT